MNEWINDLLLIITAVSAIIAVLIAFLFRKRKSLSYKLVSITPLLTVEEEEKGKLKITYEDKPVTNAHILTLKVINSGNVPVEPDNYISGPINFIFKDASKILSAEVIEENPENIKAQITVAPSGSVLMEPVLLNGGDYVTLKVILELNEDEEFEDEKEFEGKLTVDGRIIGVKNIQPLKKSKMPYLMPIIGIILMGAGILINWFTNYTDISVVLIIIGYIFLLLGVFAILFRFRNKNFQIIIKEL